MNAPKNPPKREKLLVPLSRWNAQSFRRQEFFKYLLSNHRDLLESFNSVCSDWQENNPSFDGLKLFRTHQDLSRAVTESESTLPESCELASPFADWADGHNLKGPFQVWVCWFAFSKFPQAPQRLNDDDLKANRSPKEAKGPWLDDGQSLADMLRKLNLEPFIWSVDRWADAHCRETDDGFLEFPESPKSHKERARRAFDDWLDQTFLTLEPHLKDCKFEPVSQMPTYIEKYFKAIIQDLLKPESASYVSDSHEGPGDDTREIRRWRNDYLGIAKTPKS